MQNNNSVVLLNFSSIEVSTIQENDKFEKQISQLKYIKKNKCKIIETSCFIRSTKCFSPFKNFILKEKGIFLSIFSALVVALGGIFYKKAKTLSGKIKFFNYYM
jgi:hypothetical protein